MAQAAGIGVCRGLCAARHGADGNGAGAQYPKLTASPQQPIFRVLNRRRPQAPEGLTLTGARAIFAAHPPAAPDTQALLRRSQELEHRLDELQRKQSAAPAPSATTAADSPPSAGIDTQAVLDQLEKRIGNLESTTVLSSPKTLVDEVHVWVDANGNEYDDHPEPSAYIKAQPKP